MHNNIQLKWEVLQGNFIVSAGNWFQIGAAHPRWIFVYSNKRIIIREKSYYQVLIWALINPFLWFLTPVVINCVTMWLLWFCGLLLNWYVLELFSKECRKTKTKPVTSQLHYPDHLRVEAKKNVTQSNCLITFNNQLKTALTGIANGSRLCWSTLTPD